MGDRSPNCPLVKPDIRNGEQGYVESRLELHTKDECFEEKIPAG